MTQKLEIALFWFRRDLRLEDNRGLSEAMKSGLPVFPIFIFDTDIIDELPKDDHRINFIYNTLEDIHKKLDTAGSSLKIIKGRPLDVFEELTKQYDIKAVYTNKDYEPYAQKRDLEIQQYLRSRDIELHTFKDQVIFEESEVLKSDGLPYTVFTPYKNKWLSLLTESVIQPYPSAFLPKSFLQTREIFPSLSSLGFEPSTLKVRPFELNNLQHYGQRRNIPSVDGTSSLSPHLRFGTVGIRTIVTQVKTNDVFLSELIWREFFMQILFHFPDVVQHNFRRKYDGIAWRNNEAEFGAWCAGKTGYPMVDAGMRELISTGYMHNRVRMITAGFLCKHLLIDWRWGEAFFAKWLFDYELSSNNGNWQWSAGTGCDSAPYFRIFNPSEQMKKFDPDLKYIKKWIPEYGTSAYPKPIVEHTIARNRALETYKRGLMNLQYK